ncbi:unnamed protein product [Rotaria socialis]|uniref:Uncharacterized protein n=1 Tax=Rotaria socialis TaxID=392032 RepID=A0A817UTJ6_9BILA|nr:unnamed protein product [Rotaria socialis]CAF3744401.1 unnamed protein product [Rotaria socialis]CAF4561789.1 unnamed protein product [Rotaria socialis]CAF4838859.1 unnamed protein product [Rotaria socialis]
MSELQSTGELRIADLNPNMAYLNFQQNSPQILNLANTEIAKSWEKVQINWNYPVDDMTLIIETPFTQKRQPYAISIDNESLKRGTSHVSRIIDDEEIELNKDGCRKVINCDSNYQIVLKLYATPAAAYLALIKYHVIKK